MHLLLHQRAWGQQRTGEGRLLHHHRRGLQLRSRPRWLLLLQGHPLLQLRSIQKWFRLLRLLRASWELLHLRQLLLRLRSMPTERRVQKNLRLRSMLRSLWIKTRLVYRVTYSCPYIRRSHRPIL
ncbi:hypothetical protein PFISCL1PPCAC_5758, partial [Pristionchus fissidentatus]